jgi:hypothetical protein
VAFAWLASTLRGMWMKPIRRIERIRHGRDSASRNERGNGRDTLGTPLSRKAVYLEILASFPLA